MEFKFKVGDLLVRSPYSDKHILKITGITDDSYRVKRRSMWAEIYCSKRAIDSLYELANKTEKELYDF
jgi:hypothetical protein